MSTEPTKLSREADPFSPESLRETARLGIAISGKYLSEIADTIARLTAERDELKVEVERLRKPFTGDITDGMSDEMIALAARKRKEILG